MAANTPLAFEPVHQLHDRMTKGETSPVDIVEGYLDRIARYDEKLHAYIEVYADDTRTAAKAAAAAMASGHRIGPFHVSRLRPASLPGRLAPIRAAPCDSPPRGSLLVALFGKQKVNGLACLVDSAVQVGPLTFWKGGKTVKPSLS